MSAAHFSVFFVILSENLKTKSNPFMKKHFLLSCVILAICSQVYAGTVSVETAQTVALNFFKLYAPDISGHNTLTATLKYTKTEENGSVDFYVFDMNPVKGFVIVTGYDNVEPVIAYSTESYFKTSFENVGVNDWVNTYAAKINYAQRAQVAASDRIANLWTSYQQGLNPGAERTTAIGPLAVTTWDQENDISNPPPYLYNLFCPYNSSQAERCVTGCVATAMAQIMAYWKYPTTGTGSYSYNASGYGTQSVNFGATTYPWATMPSVLTLSTTGSQDSAVDLISYDAGVSVAMEYGDDDQGGSGAYVIQADAGTGNPCAQQAYAKYFGYNSTTLQGLYKSSYTSSAWTTLINNELSAGRIIQYAGQDPGVGGHTWLVDGINTSGLYHMNFGWGGADNGYFSLTDIDPSPYEFNSDDEALIGIEPPTATSCGTPTGAATSSITNTGATFTWSAVTGATSYDVQYEVVGAASWTTATASSNTFTVSTLTAGTNYQWEVAAVCSSGTSSYTAATAFETTGGVVTCGTPTGAATSSITSTGATFGWSAVSGAESYTVQYQVVGAASWTSVTTTGTSLPVTGLTASTDYQWEVETVCSGGSSSFTTAVAFETTSGSAPTYCASAASSQEYEYIKNVTLGSINNTTAAAGYANYTNLSTNLTGGSTYTITLTPGFTGSAYAEYFTVYIDYNQNGVFTNTGETVAKVEGKKAVSTTFTVPTTALNGPTRMRIQMQYGAYETNSCADYTYGGVQDYTVNINGAALTLGAPVEGSSNLTGTKLYPNPAQDNLTVAFTSGNNSPVNINVYNMTGQRVMSEANSATTGQNTINVNTGTLSAGIYIFEMENNGELQRQKFVIAR
jgi:hypothetical protein